MKIASNSRGPAAINAGSDSLRDAMYPLRFSPPPLSRAAAFYLSNPALQKLADFFQSKGLPALKNQDQRQLWYADWIDFQKTHAIYADLLSPEKYSTRAARLDLPRLTRFLEVFAWFSPAHGYSLQVSFLALFAILMGSNESLKQEAVAALEKGELLAFGVSEQHHGSDLLGNEFTVSPAAPGEFIAAGSKYYIGNANRAAIISILAQKTAGARQHASHRATPLLFALRPAQSAAFSLVKKIPTFGIRSAFVGAFHLDAHQLPQKDIIAEGRPAWDAVLGAVTLGKFFLGYGSIGICEHAFDEAIRHLTRRILYGKPVLDMPHIAAAACHAYARLTAMKLYAYRTLDYVQSASADDRRYQLFCAVQKARVSTQGVKVISLLADCVGAKGFESDTYFEMARRDVQLIPNLEGSMHINLGLTAQFIPAYFTRAKIFPAPPPCCFHSPSPRENPYLMQARGGQINKIVFARYLQPYLPLKTIPNVRRFARQAHRFRKFLRSRTPRSPQSSASESDASLAMILGQCLAIIVYGQLLAEQALQAQMPREMVSTIFHLLVEDLSRSALTLASSNDLTEVSKALIARVIVVPATAQTDWDFVLNRVRSHAAAHPGVAQSPASAYAPGN